jgi:hypothetical protein
LHLGGWKGFFVVLMGLVAKSALLLVDFTDQPCATSRDREHAILEMGAEQVRGPPASAEAKRAM